MKYIQQFINLNNVFCLSEGSSWQEALKDITPPDDKKYNWSIFNTHTPFSGGLLIVWQGTDKELKYPKKPAAAKRIQPR